MTDEERLTMLRAVASPGESSSADADTHRAAEGAVVALPRILATYGDAASVGMHKTRGGRTVNGVELLPCPFCGEAATALQSLRADHHGGWQPIETAPKDGTIVLLVVGTESPHTVAAAWSGDEIWPWTTFDGTGISDGIQGKTATHWMPLPPAPGPEAF